MKHLEVVGSIPTFHFSFWQIVFYGCVFRLFFRIDLLHCALLTLSNMLNGHEAAKWSVKQGTRARDGVAERLKRAFSHFISLFFSPFSFLPPLLASPCRFSPFLSISRLLGRKFNSRCENNPRLFSLLIAVCGGQKVPMRQSAAVQVLAKSSCRKGLEFSPFFFFFFFFGWTVLAPAWDWDSH